MLSTPEFWVLVSFILFVGLLVYYKVPALATKALDDRAERIRLELAEAQRLREEAQSLLAEYERKRGEAQKEAEAILALARTEAEALAQETRRKLADTIERRTRMAEDKITQAETQAVKDLRAAMADVAVAAASHLVAAESKGAKGARLVAESIAAIKDRLN